MQMSRESSLVIKSIEMPSWLKMCPTSLTWDLIARKGRALNLCLSLTIWHCVAF